jgi:trafficking protein particle complex subunit 5
LGGLSVDAYLSGIIAGILEGAGFPARVTAHSVALEEGEAQSSSGGPSNTSASTAALSSLPPRKEKAVFLVKFHKSVLAREAAMN